MLNGFGHITSGITIELIFVIVFAIAVVLYFLMMRRSEEGVAPSGAPSWPSSCPWRCPSRRATPI